MQFAETQVQEKIKSPQYLSCIKPRYQKERKYGVFASVNIIQGKYEKILYGKTWLTYKTITDRLW